MTDLKRYRLDCADGEWTPYEEAERALTEARADAEAVAAELAELRALCKDKGGPGGVQTSTGP